MERCLYSEMFSYSVWDLLDLSPEVLSAYVILSYTSMVIANIGKTNERAEFEELFICDIKLE